MSYLAIGRNERAREELERADKLAANNEDLRDKVRAALKQAGAN
jgi:hypothetical protein